MSQNLTIFITPSQTGMRIDKALAEAAKLCGAKEAEGLSRMAVQRLLQEGAVVEADTGRVIVEASRKAVEGQSFLLSIPDALPPLPQAEVIPLSIRYEDDDLLVVDKPAGMVVHPAAGNHEGTLVNALLAHCGKCLSGIGGVARPGIVHRLDKETSGLMVVAKNDLAHQGLTSQFSDRTLSRIYQALVWGVPSPLEGEIEGAIGRHPKARQKMAVVVRGGKEAKTFYKVQEVYGGIVSLVSCKLATGRTHQIRVHMAHIAHPVVGDPLYGRQRGGGKEGLVGLLMAFPRQALHAGEISFLHPRTGKRMHFSCPLPKDMKALLKGVIKKTE